MRQDDMVDEVLRLRAEIERLRDLLKRSESYIDELADVGSLNDFGRVLWKDIRTELGLR